MTFKILLMLFAVLFSLPAWSKTESAPSAEMKPPAESKPSSASGYSKEEKVEALWQGAWYKGTIQNQAKEGFYEVHFDGYWHNRDEVLPADKIRKPVKRASPDPADLKAGDAVEIYQGDHYKPAVFVETKNNKAVVRFSNGDKPKDETVPFHKISKIQ